MGAVDLALAHGRVVTPAGVVAGGVAIDDGVIVAVGTDGGLPDARRVIDARGGWILPGAIDPHVHFREPGLTDREDFGTGSSAAAAGGVTTVLEMPNTDPPTWSGTLLQEKRRIAAAKANVDFSLFGIVGRENLDAVDGLAAAGAVGFKLYLHQSIGHLSAPDDGALLEAFERIAETGLVAAVHAENPEIIDRRRDALRAQGRIDAADNLHARPTVSESEMVERCLSFARAAGARLHICHVTAAETVAVVRRAKAAGQAVTAETGPQWLTFTQDDVARVGTLLMFSPPFRLDEDRDALWEGLRDGTIDMLASDHAPRHAEEKLCCSVWDAKSGFVGVETTVPVVASAVAAGRLDVERFAEVAAANAARTYGFGDRKGRLVPGTDADVMVVDDITEEPIDPEDLHSRLAVTPFAGLGVTARVSTTVARGRVVWCDGGLSITPDGRDVSVP